MPKKIRVGILFGGQSAEHEVSLQSAKNHSHLFLYRENGKLLRQLTNDNSGQDSAPIFAPMARASFSRAKNPVALANFGALILSAKD
jgi:D-alanine-D-alanine ligase-like ATP-grasp enzyme